MNKNSFWLVIILVVVLSLSIVLLVACQDNTPPGGDESKEPETPTEELTSQQQVDIAIKSLTSILYACLSDNATSVNLMSLANENTELEDVTDLDDLFAMLDRNKLAFTQGDGSQMRAGTDLLSVFSLALLNVLKKYGTDCLDHEITASYNFLGGNSGLAQSMKDFFPTNIVFLGTMEEGGKNVIYASVMLSIEDVGDTLNNWYDLKIYYVDKAHYGCSFLRRPVINNPEMDYRSGDFFLHYDCAMPQRFLQIQVEKYQGQSYGIISYSNTLCNDMSLISKQDIQVIYDFLDDTQDTFPKSGSREVISTVLEINLDDVIKMR